MAAKKAEEGAPAATPGRLASVRTKVEHKPPRIFLYGVGGIGKTTFAAKAPHAIIIPTEEGAEEIEVAKLPVVTSSEGLLDDLRALYKEPHSYKAVAIDTADWLQDIIVAELQQQHSEKELGYGRDSLMAQQRFGEILVALNYLRDKRSMTTIIIAHSEIRRFDSPLTEPYDRYQPKLIKSVSALLMEWADLVMFATYDVTVKSEKVGFDASVRRGVGAGERLLYTEERPAFFAKNRYSMPPELPLSFDEVAAAIPYYNHSRKEK